MADHLNRRAFVAGAFAGAAGVWAGTWLGSAQATEMDSLQKILASGKVRERYGQASEENIAAYEKKYSTRFSDQYRAFLKRENGLRFNFDFDEAEKAGIGLSLADMNTFFGVGNGNKYNDLALMTSNMGFYDKKFLPFGPVIGLGGDFCTYVEICKGEFSGQIMHTDGEIYPSKEIRGMSVEGLSVDDFVKRAIESSWFMPMASSFDALLADYAKMA